MHVPAKACDCHVHVFGAAARYPFAPERTYTPPEASVEQLLALKRLHGWVADERLFRKILVDNPARLYDFQA